MVQQDARWKHDHLLS